VAEAEEEAAGDRCLIERDEPARGVVDGGDMVGVEGWENRELVD
jgi:hypothetical protein